MIRANLRMTYEERIAQHQETLDTIDALHAMKAEHDAKAVNSRRRELFSRSKNTFDAYRWL